MSKITGPSLIRNGDVVALSASAAREAIKARAAGLVDLAMQESHARATFGAFERLLMVEELALARAVLSLFLAASEERVRNALGARRRSSEGCSRGSASCGMSAPTCARSWTPDNKRVGSTRSTSSSTCSPIA